MSSEWTGGVKLATKANRGRSWFAQKAGRRDGNHASIRDGLRKLGYLVADLAGAAGGIADLAVLSRASAARFEPVGVWHWLEVKMPRGRLTPAQVRLRLQWAAKGVVVHEVRTIDEALAVVS